MITITRNGVTYPIHGQRYTLSHSRLVVDGRPVPFPWLPSNRRAPSIVGVALAVLVLLSSPVVSR